MELYRAGFPEVKTTPSEDNIMFRCPDYYSQHVTGGCFEVNIKYQSYFTSLTTMRHHFINAHKAFSKGTRDESGHTVTGDAALGKSLKLEGSSHIPAEENKPSPQQFPQLHSFIVTVSVEMRKFASNSASEQDARERFDPQRQKPIDRSRLLPVGVYSIHRFLLITFFNL